MAQIIEKPTEKLVRHHLGKNQFRYKNQQTGITTIREREENYQYTRTEKQEKTRSSFGERSRLVTEWLKRHELSGDSAYQKMRRKFLKSGYKSFRGFLNAQIATNPLPEN